VELEPQVLYRARVAQIAFGRVRHERLVRTIASGRICSVLLEQEIGELFDMPTGTQGASADHIHPVLGTIQSKTYHSSSDDILKSGPRKGQRRADVPTIWTTKSGFWDRESRLSDDERQEAENYFTYYDHFMYVDISQMPDLEYSLVVVPSSQVIALKDGYRISETSVLSQVRREVVVPAAGTVTSRAYTPRLPATPDPVLF